MALDSATRRPPTTEELCAWRRSFGLTLLETAELMDVTEHEVRRWEAGKTIAPRHGPRLVRLLALTPPPGLTRRKAEPTPPRFADQLRDWRGEHGVSRTRLGKLVGASSTTLSRWENGTVLPHARTLDKVLAVLAGPPPPLPPPPSPRAPRQRREPKRKPAAPRRWEGIAFEEIGEWRRREGVSRLALARLLGVAEPTVFTWESGTCVPSAAVQRRVKAVLKGERLAPAPVPTWEAPPSGAAIRRWREREGWSRRRLADALLVSEGAVALWESAKARPRRSSLAGLCSLLEHGSVSLEGPGRWDLLAFDDYRRWRRWCRVGSLAVAGFLGVELTAVHAWDSGVCAPSLEVQRRLEALVRLGAGARAELRRAGKALEGAYAALAHEVGVKAKTRRAWAAGLTRPPAAAALRLRELVQARLGESPHLSLSSDPEVTSVSRLLHALALPALRRVAAAYSVHAPVGARPEALVDALLELPQVDPIEVVRHELRADEVAGVAERLGMWSSGTRLQVVRRLERFLKWRPFAAAREYARSLELRGHLAWRARVRAGDLPADVPGSPHVAYRGLGWASWGDFLGTGNKGPREHAYRSFDEARAFVRSLHLKGSSDWTAWCRGDRGDLPPRPDDVPTNPHRAYKGQWRGVGDWLGTGSVPTRGRKYRPFTDAREFVQSLGLRSQHEYFAWWRGAGRESLGLPAHAFTAYAAEWKGWGDFLGTGNVAPGARVFLPFDEARAFARRLGLKTEREWHLWLKGALGRKTTPRPPGMPTNPRQTYPDQWAGFSDWLDKPADTTRRPRAR